MEQIDNEIPRKLLTLDILVDVFFAKSPERRYPDLRALPHLQRLNMAQSSKTLLGTNTGHE